MQLTTKESSTLDFIFHDALDNIGASDKESLLADNCSWFRESDLSGLGYNKHQIAGILGALELKGLIIKDGSDWCLTEDGILAA